MTSSSTSRAPIDTDSESKKKRRTAGLPPTSFKSVLYAFTAIDNDYGPPFIDTVIADDYDEGLEKLKTSLTNFYEEQAKSRKEQFNQDLKVPTFDWKDIDAQITRAGFYDDGEVCIFVKRFNLKHKTRHFIE